MKKVVILSSSPRKNGNTETLCRQFEKGALEAGHQVEFVRVADQKLGYCQACYVCKKTGKCFQNDGLNELAQKLIDADVILFSSPAYFYNMTGQLKVLIDRLVSFYPRINNKDIYIFTAAWEPDPAKLNAVAEAVRCCTRDCLEGCTEKGVILATGAYDLGDIQNRPELQQAYEMGKNC